MGLYLNEDGVLTPIAGRGDLTAIRSEMSYLGAKNLLPFNLGHIKKVNGGGTWNGNVYTYRDITYTVNADGTITVDGTASADSIFRVLDNLSLDFGLKPDKTYYYTGSPATGSSASTYYSYYSELVGGTWTYFMNYGASDTSVTPNASATQIVVDIFVKSGKTIDNQVFKPMLRLASDPDSTYQPYAYTNQQLTAKTDGLWDNTMNNGAVNLLENVGTTTAVNGITFTVNSDGTVTVSGTATANASLTLKMRPYLGNSFPLKLTGCPAGGSFASGYRLQYANYFDMTDLVSDEGDGAIITKQIDYTTYPNARISIEIRSGTKISSPIVFKPMVSDASLDLSYNDYLPYAKTNRELTESKANIIYGTNIWSANTPVTITLPRLGGLLVGGRSNKGFAIYVCENGNELVVLSGGDFVTASISDLTISLTFSSVYGTSFNWKYINSETGSY